MSLINDKYVIELSRFINANGRKKKFLQGPIDIGEFQSNEIIFVENGYVVAEVGFEKSKNRAINIFGPKDLFRQELLIMASYGDMIYKALTDCSLYSIEKNLLESEAENNTSIAMAILHITIDQNMIRFRRIENLSLRYVSDKLIYRILYLSQRFGKRYGRQVIIQIPLTHHEFSSFINVARESVSREIEKLVDRKIITYENQLITILDEKRLISSLHERARTNLTL